jgi:hypothetical protein
MTPVPLEEADALLDARLNIRVVGHDGQMISASIWPTRLTASHVNGVVEWHGTDILSSVVSAQGDESPWGQRVLLVWAAVGPQSVAVVPVLGAAQWRLARLTMPDLDGRPGDTVRVSLNRQHWTATLPGLPGRTRHFAGSNVRDRHGQVSSAISEMDPITRTGRTASGRVYKLGMRHGLSSDGEYTWRQWLRINNAEDIVDVTAEVERLLAGSI